MFQTKKLMSFSGDLSQLNEADRFMVMLVQVPGCVFLLWFKAFEGPTSVLFCINVQTAD